MYTALSECIHACLSAYSLVLYIVHVCGMGWDGVGWEMRVRCAVNLHIALFPGHFTSGWEDPVKLARVGVKGKHGASYPRKYSIVNAVHP